MSGDIADNADATIQANLERALAHREHVPTECEECGDPCDTLPNGLICRFCKPCRESHEESTRLTRDAWRAGR